MLLLNLNPGYWALYAIGEHTVLRIWLEFPDYNIPTRSDSSGSCVPEEWISSLSSGPLQADRTESLSADANWMNAIMSPMGIMMP